MHTMPDLTSDHGKRVTCHTHRFRPINPNPNP